MAGRSSYLARRTSPGGSARGDRWRSAVLPAALCSLGLLAAACGGRPAASGVASIGSVATTTTSPTAGTAGLFPGTQKVGQDAVAFAECMRAHGLPNFPDPVITPHSVQQKMPYSPSSPSFKRAASACKRFQPNGGSPPSAAQLAALTAKLLKFARCMRSHGVPAFPDPSVSTAGGGLQIRIGGPGLDQSSPLFRHAMQACRSLLPGGGPP